MDNFYNLSKYIGLKHIQKFRICSHWANEIYYARKDKFDLIDKLINDSNQRQKYLWLYLKKSLVKANYIDNKNIMYFIHEKLNTIIKVMNKTIEHRSYPFYYTATNREINNNYFIKSIGKYYHYIVHVIYVNTDDMYKVLNVINHILSSNFIKKLKKGKALKEYNRICNEIEKHSFFGYDGDEILCNQHSKITQDGQIPDKVFCHNFMPIKVLKSNNTL